MTTTTTTALTWKEPAGCTSPRGWLYAGETCVGNYLDYGPDHYRAPHESEIHTINGPRMRQWCEPGRLCRECQPGSVHAMRYPGGPGTVAKSRYFETVAEARAWIETGS